MMCGLETVRRQKAKLEEVEMKIMRFALRVTRSDKIKNE